MSVSGWKMKVRKRVKEKQRHRVDKMKVEVKFMTKIRVIKVTWIEVSQLILKKKQD